MCAGDLLAKNAFVALGCVVKGQYLRAPTRLAAGAVIASADTPGRLHPVEGGMEGGLVEDAMQRAQGAHARRAPPDLHAPRPPTFTRHAPRPMPTPPAPRPPPPRHPPPTPPRPAPRRPAPYSTRCSPAELISD
jgi:hypothetical protein